MEGKPPIKLTYSIQNVNVVVVLKANLSHIPLDFAHHRQNAGEINNPGGDTSVDRSTEILAN